MIGRRGPRFREFLSLAQPLMVGGDDGPTVVLAFAIATDGKLVAMTVAPGGGQVSFPEVQGLTFPPVVQTRTVAQGQETISDIGNRQSRRQRERGDA